MLTWGDLYKVDKKEIDWTQNRILPKVEFKMPDVFQQEESLTPNDWISYPLGVFLVATPKKKEEGHSISREIEGYDKLLILLEDKLTERLTLTAGSTYYGCMVEVLESAGVKKYNIENSEKTLDTDKEFEPGREKLRVLNELASELNFTQFYVDEYGYFRCEPYTPPDRRGVDYEYLDNEQSITLIGAEEDLDLYNIPNVWRVTVSNPDKEPLFSTYENTNRDHPRSVSSLGRRIVRFEEKNDIADQEALDAYVERIAVEASQIYGKLIFQTAIMPFHGYNNVLRFRNQTLGIDAKYTETGWKLPLQAGGQMEHNVRRSVKLN